MTDTKLREAARAVLEWHDGLGGTRTDDRIEALRAALDEPPDQAPEKGDVLPDGGVCLDSDGCGTVHYPDGQAPEPTERAGRTIREGCSRLAAIELLNRLAYDHANAPENLEESIKAIFDHDARRYAAGVEAGRRGAK